MKFIVFTIALVALAPVTLLAETHPAVQAALDYEIPPNTCGDKTNIGGETSVTAPSQSSGSTSFFEGSSTASVSDVDSYSRKRAERKEKRRMKCVAKYKKGLLKDMEKLKGSAKHGLTQDQATKILSNIAQIQKVYMTKDGILVADAPADAAQNNDS